MDAVPPAWPPVRPYAREDRPEPEILLVSMPWTNVIEPGLGLALLKAILARRGVQTRVLHLNLFALEFLKASTYDGISVVYALNDFLFSHGLDPVVTDAQRRHLRVKAEDLAFAGALDPERVGSVDAVIERLLHLRAEVIPRWLERWADELAASPARLIGFTCMFDQTIASLALAKLVKQRAPEKLVALGGYAVRDPTGSMVMQSHPWVDAICTGEGETTILDLAEAARGARPLHAVRGILHRGADGAIIATPAAPKADLDANPVPDYSDFFADTARLSAECQVDLTPASIPVENSRGCWWGAKHHCVFCGIDKPDLVYRHRAAETVLEGLRTLRARHGMSSFRFSDYILPHGFYKTLLPMLAAEQPKFTLSCEMKSNVTEEHFRLLADAGFHEVQPGIESFSSEVLRRIDKGVTAIQNVFTLKLGRKYGIRILYNILYGFPDDTLPEYRRMETLLPKLAHFDPPVSCVPVQVTRYAPLQATPERFGIPPAAHGPTYELIFSRDYVERTGFRYEDFCYYFERGWENSLHLQQSYGRIHDTVKAWGIPQNDLFASLHILQTLPDGGALVLDSRGGIRREHALDALALAVLEVTDRPVSEAALLEGLGGAHPAPAIAAALAWLEAEDLVIREDDRLLSLVLPCAPVSEGSYRTGVTLPEAVPA
ncbi:RiPP maturation radical SAM C-methyltransferase [Sediminicoccus rosea]|uniref:RiPP maturation radical SAM C-methyltransferase n=1 Tax=Sediminicoccus rosea TaxID=1225128 RepID=A0ABZ0PL62_9PROT|nr:RiPP maturation radical SAM C-methyltransferase [Sediminicoccus rosea]WPB86300.1 RiPP maturation radical SAM C-methyltransferase [Sediminicoccus rosea]